MADGVTSTIKSNLNPMTIIKTAIGLVVLFAILDFLNLTKWIIEPIKAYKGTDHFS